MAWSSAQVYSQIGNLEGERASLDIAIQRGVHETRARRRRALILGRDPDRKLAQEDLRAVVSSVEAGVPELVSSILQLRDVDENWLDTVATSPAVNKLKDHELVRVARALLVDRVGAGLSIELLKEYKTTWSRSALALAKISFGDYAEAKRVLGRKEDILVSDNIQDVFNYACVEWGDSGTAPVEVFSHVTALVERRPFLNEANFLQCLALSSYVIGNFDATNSFLADARKALEGVRSTVFSC